MIDPSYPPLPQSQSPPSPLGFKVVPSAPAPPVIHSSLRPASRSNNNTVQRRVRFADDVDWKMLELEDEDDDDDDDEDDDDLQLQPPYLVQQQQQQHLAQQQQQQHLAAAAQQRMQQQTRAPRFIDSMIPPPPTRPVTYFEIHPSNMRIKHRRPSFASDMASAGMAVTPFMNGAHSASTSSFSSAAPLTPPTSVRGVRRHSFDGTSRPTIIPPWEINPSLPPILPQPITDLVLHPNLDAYTLSPDFRFSLSSSFFLPVRFFSPHSSIYATPLVNPELTLPATRPPISHLRIIHEDIPQWPISIRNLHGHPITLGDVLWAVHKSLHESITPGDWAMLATEEGNEGKLRVARAYHRRCKASPDSSERHNGVKRVDYLWAWEGPRRREVLFGGFMREERAKRGRAPELWTLMVA
jgi:hypothetical protein